MRVPNNLVKTVTKLFKISILEYEQAASHSLGNCNSQENHHYPIAQKPFTVLLTLRADDKDC